VGRRWPSVTCAHACPQHRRTWSFVKTRKVYSSTSGARPGQAASVRGKMGRQAGHHGHSSWLASKGKLWQRQLLLAGFEAAVGGMVHLCRR
jgi:hypothetical protein